MKSKIKPEAGIVSEEHSSRLCPGSLLVLKQGSQGISGIKQLLVILGSFLVVGCAGNLQKYQEPVDGERARVRFIDRSSGELFSYGDKECRTNRKEWMTFYNPKYILREKTNKSLGMPKNSVDSYLIGSMREVYVSTGRPHYFMFQSSAGGSIRELITSTFIMTNAFFPGGYFCGAPFGVTFEDGKDYEIEYRFNRFYGVGCSVSGYELKVDEQGEMLKEPIELERPVNMEYCLKALKRPRLI